MSEAQEVTDLILGKRQDAAQTAVGSLGDDPDAAARAIKLSTMTGVPAAAIEPNVDEFEADQKAAITAHILNNNTHISDYVNSHPLASKVSNDDYGQLDLVSQKMKQFGGASVVHEAMKGFAEGYGERAFGEWLYKRPQDIEFVKDNPLMAATLSVLGLPIEFPAKLFGGAIGAIKSGSEEAAVQLGMDPSRASRMSRDLAAMAELMVQQPGLLPHGGAGQVREQVSKKYLESVRPYIDAGIEPPIGVHPLFDQLKIEQSKLDLKNYDEVMKEAQGSLTKERAPDLFAQFVRQQTDQKIGISAEAIEKMYGEKVPSVGDGKLGFISNIEEQFRVAKETGGDIEVPLADWLAHVDPALAKELHDDVRIRRGGVTTNETKLQAQAMVEAYHGSPHEFEAFSLDKIGTGEGAQAYGHGLYFAEHREVASSYQSAGRRGTVLDTIGGRHWNSNDPAHVAAYYVYHKGGGDPGIGGGLLRDDMLKAKKAYDKNPLAGEYKKLDRALQLIHDGDYPEFDYKGNMYRVRINAEKEHFLDWDKALSEQDPTVRDRLAKMEGAPNEILKGEEAYKSLTFDPIKGVHDFTGELASKRLREAGIPGIKYLDQGSRVVDHLEEVLREIKTTQRLYDRETNIDKRTDLGQRLDELHKEADRLETIKPTYNYVIFDPSIIQITHINDAAIEAIRSSSDLKPLLDRPALNEILNRYRGEFEQHGPELKIFVPEGEWTPVERQAVDAAVAELERILPGRQYQTVPGREIVLAGREVKGAYQPYADRLPTIAFLANPESAVQVARHEAIHYLRRQGFFTPKEWTDLKAAAYYNGWLEKHHVAERWPELAKAKDAATMIEEAIAEEFVDWRKQQERRTVAGKIFAKLNELSQKVIEAIKTATGLGDKAYEVFSRIESGEIGSRKGTKPLDPSAFKGEAQEFEATQQQLFVKASAIGMTVDQFKRYMKLIEKRNAEDVAWAEKKILEQTKREQTAEWKANRSRVKDEVAHDIEARPDIAVSTFLNDYNLKINLEGLSKEQRESLPRSLLSSDGLPADELAARFGFHSGDAMVERLALLDTDRGKGGFKEYLEKVINAETDQRMLREYGDLNENILRDAKDHVLGDTQMDLLHEETLALGMKIGQAPLDKATLKATFQQAFGKLRTAIVDTDKFLAEAGRAGKAAEMALLKEDFTEAFRQKQKQYFSILGANEAKALDKDMQRFEKNAKRFSKREVEGISPEYTNFVHDVLMRVGQPIRRSVQDLGEAIRKDGYTSLENFVSEKEQALRDLHVPEFLLDQGFRKTLPELSVEEFRQVNDAIKAMIFNGRDELKIEKAGEKVDIENVIKEMKEKLASLDATYERRLGPNRGVKAALETGKSWWWSGITVESMLNRVDRDNPRGIFNQTIVRPFAEASNYKDKLIRDFQAKMSEVPKVKDLDKKIDNDLFLEPFSKQPLQMRRRNVLGILQNIGNESNLKKLAGGYGLEPAQVIQWVLERTTKEDWDRAQKIGDVFEEVYQLADRMSHNVSGVGIQRIPLSPIDTPFGSYRGWYNPIKYDQVRPGESKKLIGASVEQEGFYRATTPQGYTTSRTGYVAPIELDLDIVPQRMRQMIHDIAMRPAVLQLSKLFYNRQFKDAMIEHLGEHRAESMIPFLRDIANAPNFLSLEQSYANTAIEYLRQNTIATLIGLNPGTVMKHGTTALINSFTEVSAKDFLREITTMLRDDGTGRSNWRMAMDKSEELQRRMKNYQELVAGHGSEINLRGAASMFGSFREFLMQVGATPVSISDLLSAVPTFLAKYKQEIANGADEGLAVDIANRAVRHAHGSSVLSNKPAIMRTNALGAMFSSLYGFFSHMQQKQYELAWKARDLIKGNDKDVVYNPKTDLMKGLFSYIIIPAIIEELVTPYTNAEKDSWGLKAAKTLGLGISSSFIGIRDAVRAVVNQRDPQAGMTGASLKALTDLPRDLGSKQPMTKERAANIIRHTFTLTGVLTGLTNQQEGALAQYLYRYSQGLERPKGPWDVAVGMRYGKTDKHSRTFEEWKKHTFGGH